MLYSAGCTVRDSVAEAHVVTLPRSRTQSKGQFGAAKSSASEHHTVTRKFITIYKSMCNFGTTFCYLKNEKLHTGSTLQTFGCLLEEIQA